MISQSPVFPRLALSSHGDTYDFLVVIFKCLVGSLTGPLTRRSLSLARLTRSVETISSIDRWKPDQPPPIHLVRLPSQLRLLTLLEVLDAPAGQGDPDLVDLGTPGSTGLLEILFAGHFVDLIDFSCSDSDL